MCTRVSESQFTFFRDAISPLMADSSSSLHWFCWVNIFSNCFSCASARDRLYSWYKCSWWVCSEKTLTSGWTREDRFIFQDSGANPMWPDSSKRPELGRWCPGLCLAADLPAPWLCSPQRATAQSSRCPASRTAQRRRQGRWPGSGWTRPTRVDHRKHESKPWPRRSRPAWSYTLGSYTGACHRRETWPPAVENTVVSWIQRNE